MNTEKINRFEIIDHTRCRYCLGTGKNEEKECTGCNGIGCVGRTVVFWDDKKQIDIEMQDHDQTLKVFIHERYDDATM